MLETDAYRESFTAPDARVLAVDDNELNLMVVEGLLKNTKVQITTCQSGKQCLELMQKEYFHIILLDHMMPEMDGIEVIRKTKTLEGNKCQSSVMIALTANAIKGVREMYLNEGFADYLTKPVEGAKLEQMVKKHLPKELVCPPETLAGSGRGNSDDSASQAPEPRELPEADAEGKVQEMKEPASLLDHAMAMQYCMGSEKLYRKALGIYCSTEEKTKEKLEQYLAEGRLDNYRVEIHALKTTSKSIGCQSLFDFAFSLEKACREGDGEYVAQNHNACMELYSRVADEAERYLEKEN